MCLIASDSRKRSVLNEKLLNLSLHHVEPVVRSLLHVGVITVLSFYGIFRVNSMHVMLLVHRDLSKNIFPIISVIVFTPAHHFATPPENRSCTKLS